MKNWLLKAKHWQLFLATIGIPFFGYFVLLTIAFLFGGYLLLMFGILLLSLGTLLFYFGWLWTIGTKLGPKITTFQTFDVSGFRLILLGTIIAYCIAFCGLIFFSFSTGAYASGIMAIFAMGLYVLAIFGYFHTIYQCAKIIKALEFQSKVTFGDFVGEFFLFWFYLIGIWIIQPKINAFVEQRVEKDTIDHLVE